MTIRTKCEVCKKVIRYTDDREQENQSIENPEQFCEGHIAEPNEEALSTIMKILRTTGPNPNNRFFIAKSDGHYISSGYLNSKDGSYFPSTPKGSYELGAGKKSAKSYDVLRSSLHEQWLQIARDEKK